MQRVLLKKILNIARLELQRWGKGEKRGGEITCGYCKILRVEYKEGRRGHRAGTQTGGIGLGGVVAHKIRKNKKEERKRGPMAKGRNMKGGGWKAGDKGLEREGIVHWRGEARRSNGWRTERKGDRGTA